MGDLPKRKECEVRSHYNGWPTQVEDRKNVKWSCYNGWPTQVEDRKNVKWSRYNGWPTQMEDGGLIVMGDLPRKKWCFFFKKMVSLLRVTYPKIECDLPGQKDLAGAVLTGQGWETWHLLGAGWLEDSLMTRLISSFLWDSPTGRVHLILFSFQDLNRFCHHQLNDSFFVHNLTGLHWGSFCNKSQVCAMLWGLMTCMHPYLMWNIGPPLWWSIVIGCLYLLTKAFLALPMYWLIRLLAFHSNVSVVPISGCLRRLLLSLFIKLDNAPKCGVAGFIMKDFISFGFFWELSSDWLCASCQHPSRWSTSHGLASSWNITPQVYVVINLHGTAKSSGHASHTLQ